jgi:hypothetical protein
MNQKESIFNMIFTRMPIKRAAQVGIMGCKPYKQFSSSRSKEQHQASGIPNPELQDLPGSGLFAGMRYVNVQFIIL